MGFNLEGRKSNEIKEVPDHQVDSEKLSETEETAENFDDCSLCEVKDDSGSEVNSKTLESAEDDFEDCEAKLEEMEEDHPELADDDSDDFDDCGKETDGGYVAEVTYTTDGEISREEAEGEIQDAYNECDDPENMAQLKENANENEHIEVVNAEVVERPDKTFDDIDEAEYEDAKREYEEAREHLEEQQEAAEEYEERLDEMPEDEEPDDDIPDQPQESDVSGIESDSSDVEEPVEGKELPEGDGEDKPEDKIDESESELTSDEIESLDSDDEIKVEKIDQDEVTEDSVDTIEEETETELTEETKEEFVGALKEGLDRRAGDGTLEAEEAQEAISEQVEEKVDTLETAKEAASEEIAESAEAAVDSEEGLSADAIKEKVEDDTSEAVEQTGLDEEEVGEIIEERSEEIDETIEGKQEDAELKEEVEEITEEIDSEEEVIEEEKRKKSLDERIDAVFIKDDATSSEVSDLAAENAEALDAVKGERSDVEADMSEKFDDVTSMERGTDQYRQALQEYNALKDKKEELDEKAAVLTDRQDRIERKSLELREAQLSRGEAAAAASVITLASAKALEGRFDEEYYSPKPGRTELGHLREENSATIKELSDEKASLRLAMDAKMGQISDYIISHNMGRYETSVDPYYRQLTQEYLSLKSAHDSVGYSIVKLDENNARISEALGDEYVSMRELPPRSAIIEVVQGQDIPHETNYFIDEARASEVLTKFNQSEWEKLTLREQKRAVEQLADYNAEILGVEEKPRIVYYRKEDANDFGGYSSQQNAIYINEYNMTDAAETADTISHEYRHKYQHERAEKLENERDLAFKEGFDDYIRAEDDYYGYKNQLVEVDARDYATVVKEKIDSYSDTADVDTEDSSEYESATVSFARLGPKKGALFDGEGRGYHRILAPEEVTVRWKNSLHYVDEQIEIYREELTKRGVSNGVWLNSMLAKHRALMFEQEGYNLDLASGHGEDSVHRPDAYQYPTDFKFYDDLANEYFAYETEKISCRTFLTNDGERITYEDAVNRITAKAMEYMDSMEDVDEAVKASAIADMRAELFKQHIVAESRGLGDHGIRHIYGNFERGENYLMSRDDVSGEQKLAVLVSQVYHDEGYTTAPNSRGTLKEGNSDEKHDEASLTIWHEAERQNIYKRVFSPASIASIEVAIGKHNSGNAEEIKANTALESDPVVSTVHICDKLALSQREKFSELILSDPKLVELTEGMNAAFVACRKMGMCDEYGKPTEQGALLYNQYHQQINDYIDLQGYDSEYAARLKAAVDKDVGINSGKFSSRMNYIYTPSDCYRYNADTGRNEITVYIIVRPDSASSDIANKQVEKMLGDLGLSEDELQRAITEGEYDLGAERGLYVRVEPIAEDEIKAIESAHYQENDDLKEVNERIENGRAEYNELTSKLTEIAKRKRGNGIAYKDFRKIVLLGNNTKYLCKKEEFDMYSPSEKEDLIKKMISDMILERVSETLR